MPLRSSFALASFAVLALAAPLAGASCSSSPVPSPPPPSVCSSASSAAFEAVGSADVAVYLEASDPILDPVVADLGSYLGSSWGASLTVNRAVPDFTKKRTIWLSTSDAAAAKAGVSIAAGYAIERVNGANGSAAIVVYAKDATNLAFGAYALLEELGIRFFHPKQELVPRRASPALPSRST